MRQRHNGERNAGGRGVGRSAPRKMAMAPLLLRGQPSCDTSLCGGGGGACSVAARDGKEQGSPGQVELAARRRDEGYGERRECSFV